MLFNGDAKMDKANTLLPDVKDIDVKVYFKHGEVPVPYLLYMENEDGEMTSVKINKIEHSERTIYCGETAYEYDCSIAIFSIEVPIKLFFHTVDCSWKIKLNR